MTKVALEYRYNSRGIRDKDYSAAPAAGRFRVLLLGAGLDGFGLLDKNLASRVLESSLQKIGLKNAEVILGSISGFYVPRSVRLGAELIAIYRPQVVVLNFSSASLPSDLIESLNLNSSGYNDVLDPTFVGWPETWIWSQSSVAARIWSGEMAARQVLQRREISDIAAPTFEAIESLKAVCQRSEAILLLTYADGYPWLASRGYLLGSFWETLLKWTRPHSIYLPADYKARLAKLENLTVLPLPFSTAYREGIFRWDRRESYSRYGVRIWVNSIFESITHHIETLSK